MIGEILSSAMGGAGLGLLGTVVQGGMQMLNAGNERKAKAMDYAQELALQKMQAEARATETENEQAMAIEDTLRETQAASYAHDTALNDEGVWDWVKSIRALLRPFITIYVIGLVTYFFISDTLTQEQRGFVIESVVTLNSAIILWWFGGRAIQQKGGAK